MSDAGLCVALINWYAIPRGLHHCRDLAEPEPFDFLTWFEFAQKATAEFDQLLKRLRASEEWKYVERDSISPFDVEKKSRRQILRILHRRTNAYNGHQ